MEIAISLKMQCKENFINEKLSEKYSRHKLNKKWEVPE